jgi:hypothetical protein
MRDTNGDGRIDQRDNPDIYAATVQPVSVQRLAGTVIVVSPRGSLPGPAFDGEYYPPIVSVVQQ